METEEEVLNEKVHHGHNIRRARIRKGKSQREISESVFLSQQAVSKHETQRRIDDEMLQRYAKALNVPFENLKTEEEEGSVVIIENNNTINDSENVNIGNSEMDNNHHNVYNPIAELAETYKQLLEAEKAKSDILEKRLLALEQAIHNK